MSETADRNPDGDPIEVHTLWLDFGEEGETAISLDLTKYLAAMERLRRAKPHRHEDKR